MTKAIRTQHACPECTGAGGHSFMETTTLTINTRVDVSLQCWSCGCEQTFRSADVDTDGMYSSDGLSTTKHGKYCDNS